jgi:hypothetical protein
MAKQLIALILLIGAFDQVEAQTSVSGTACSHGPNPGRNIEYSLNAVINGNPGDPSISASTYTEIDGFYQTPVASWAEVEWTTYVSLVVDGTVMHREITRMKHPDDWGTPNSDYNDTVTESATFDLTPFYADASDNECEIRAVSELRFRGGQFYNSSASWALEDICGYNGVFWGFFEEAAREYLEFEC